MILRRQSYAPRPPGASTFADGSPVKRNEPCLDTPSLPLCAPRRGESPARCATRLAAPDATLICRGDFHARRCDTNSKGAVLVFFTPPPPLRSFFFFLSYRLSCTRRSVRRRPRGAGAGERGFGKHLTARGATRCRSCSAVEREIPSSGR